MRLDAAALTSGWLLSLFFLNHCLEKGFGGDHGGVAAVGCCAEATKIFSLADIVSGLLLHKGCNLLSVTLEHLVIIAFNQLFSLNIFFN